MFKNLLLAATILSASSSALSETTIPNAFSFGDVIVAASMNENFEAVSTGVNANETALAALMARVDALELNSGSASFEGSYRVTGLEFTLDSCSGAPQVNNSTITGTAISSGGVVSFTDSQDRFVLRNGHLDEGSSVLSAETLNDTFDLVIDAAGVFTNPVITGGMSEDGSTFVLTLNSEENEDCHSYSVTQLIGVRVSQ